jgi:hypothetical protein
MLGVAEQMYVGLPNKCMLGCRTNDVCYLAEQMCDLKAHSSYLLPVTIESTSASSFAFRQVKVSSFAYDQ